MRGSGKIKESDGIHRDGRGAMLLISVASLAGGTAASYWIERQPAARARYELWAGLLLVAGFALIGAALPAFRL
jgi:hypothetical protein